MDKKRGGGLTIKTIQSFNLKQKKKKKNQNLELDKI